MTTVDKIFSKKKDIEFISTSFSPSRVKEKIGSIAKRCFEALKLIVTFPLRFLGSKTWSIPGLILRTPLILFKRLIGKADQPLATELFGAGYHFGFNKTPTPEELKPYYPYACASAFMHANYLAYVPNGWTVVKPSTLTLLPNLLCKESCFFDPNTGLKISILQKDDQLIVGFGALFSSDEELGNDASAKQKVQRQMQWSVVYQFLGGSPSIYEHTNQSIKLLREDPLFQNKKITLVGHSYGGSLAEYVALKQNLPAVCLNSVPLGGGLQQEIGLEALQKADQIIQHIASTHDVFMDLPILPTLNRFTSLLGLRTPGTFGRKWLIPSFHRHPFKSHAHIFKNISAHLGYGPHTNPVDVKI